jgi:hypothetical protein
MSLFVQMIYLASGLSLLYIFLLYRANPLRRLPATTVTVIFTLGMIALIPVALIHRLLPLDGGGAGQVQPERASGESNSSVENPRECHEC